MSESFNARESATPDIFGQRDYDPDNLFHLNHNIDPAD